MNYRGGYSTETVRSGWPAGREGGRYAVVVVDARSGRLLETLVVNRPPVRFSRVLV